MTKEQLTVTAKALPKDERLDLAMEFWDAIDVSSHDLPLFEEQRAELDQRVADDDAQPQPAEEWTSLRKKLLNGEF